MLKQLTITLLLALTGIVNAQWSQDPYHPKYVGGGREPRIAPDGSGGVFIVAQRQNYQLYAMAVDRYGNQRWEEWLYVGGSSRHSRTPYVSGPGDGTVTIAFWGTEIDSALAIFDVMAQRIDTTGTLLWGEDGIILDGEGRDESLYATGVVARPNGDAFISWAEIIPYDPDDPNAPDNQDSHLMRISAEGEMLWDEPVVFDWIEDHTASMVMIPYESEIITGVQTHYNKISNDGELLWGGEGVETGGTFGDGYHFIQVAVPDDEGGIIGAYVHELRIPDRYREYAIYAQRISENGNLPWGDNGFLSLDTANDRNPFSIRNHRIVSLQDGDCVVGWRRKDEDQPSRVRMQRLNKDGRKLWGDLGIEPSDVAQSIGVPELVSSGDDVIVFWYDSRWRDADPESELQSVYSQKLNRDGERLWDDEDVPILITENNIYEYYVCSDANGGAIIFFGAVLVQVSRNGNLGEVLPLEVKPTLPEKGQEKSSLKLRCYPNPSNNLINLKIETRPFNPIEIGVYTVDGSIVEQISAESGASGFYDSDFNAGSIATGIYIVRAVAHQETALEKLCVIK